MKNLYLGLFLVIFSVQFSTAQIIDSLPYFKAGKLINQTLEPFFSTLNYPPGSAKVRQAVSYTSDADIGPIFLHQTLLKPLSFYLGQAYSSNKQVNLLDEFEQTMYRSILIPDRKGKFAIAYFKLPKKSPAIKERADFDLLKYSSALGSEETKFLENEMGMLDRVFGLLLLEKPNGKFKVFPNPGQILGDKGGMEEAKRVADRFLKAIRENDAKTFNSLLSKELRSSNVWTDMRPLSNYRKLPEYRSGKLEFERIVAFENQAGWRGHIGDFAVVYRLPKGMKVSPRRAPTDLLNPVNFPGMDGSSKEPGFIKVPEGYYSTIIGGPLIGTIISEENNPQGYLTITMVNVAGTNNFNIGMPPSMKK